MLDSVTSALQIAARNAATGETPRPGTAAPNVAQATAGDEFPPSPASLVFTPASQGRFASTESFVAIVESAGQTSALFGSRPEGAPGDPRAARDLARRLDELAASLDIEA